VKYQSIIVALIAFLLQLPSWSCLAQSQPFPHYFQSVPQNAQCAPPQPAPPPVARCGKVKSPVSCRPPSLPPYPPGEVRYRPSQSLLFRGDVAVEPGPGCNIRSVPLRFREPGPLQPMISHGVGLIGATIAAPFRLAEILCPLPPRPCKPMRAPSCGPMHPGPPISPACYPMPLPCLGGPHACLQPVVCAPVGPAVAPLPPAPCAPRCGPNVPSRLMEEYQFPQYEAQDLLSGIWNFSGTLIRTGRLAGDIHKTSPCGAPAGQ
jgi:hypothetical protein